MHVMATMGTFIVYRLDVFLMHCIASSP